MKQRRLFCLVGCLLLGATLVGCKARPALDHFRVYDVYDRPVEQKVVLTGQFDEVGKKARVARLVHFANPVQKNNHQIIDKNAHLTWYYIQQRNPEPNRYVTFKNQFGKQTWLIGPATHLLLPTQKVEPGSAFPKRLDHFKVYRGLDPIGVQPHANLALKDQFGAQTNVPLGGPSTSAFPFARNERARRARSRTRGIISRST